MTARPSNRPAERPMVEVRGLVRDYPAGGDVVHALRGIDLEVARGELLAVRGRSGSGKTTLLNLLGGLDEPTAGTRASSTGREISDLDEDAAAGVRRHTIAFVFQTFGLIPILSAAENVEVPLRHGGRGPEGARPAGRRAARARRPRAAGEAPAARAVGRRAAARRDRAGARQPAAAAARRRADGPARLRDRASGSCC